MKKDKAMVRIIFLLIIIIVVCAIAIVYLLINNNKLEYAPLEIEPNVTKLKDDDKKLEAPEGGSAVRLTYSNKAKIDLERKEISLNLKNPSVSTQDMILEVIIISDSNETIIAKSGRIKPGYGLSTLPLNDKVILKTGQYNGKLNIYYYDEETAEKSIVNTNIPITIDVE